MQARRRGRARPRAPRHHRRPRHPIPSVRTSVDVSGPAHPVAKGSERAGRGTAIVDPNRSVSGRWRSCRKEAAPCGRSADHAAPTSGSSRIRLGHNAIRPSIDMVAVTMTLGRCMPIHQQPTPTVLTPKRAESAVEDRPSAHEPGRDWVASAGSTRRTHCRRDRPSPPS